MYRIEVHEKINQIAELFYRFGLWHSGDEATVKETRTKILYSVFCFLYPIFLIGGAITNDKRDESIFLMQMGVSTTLLGVKLLHIIWKKNEILALLNRLSVYEMEDRNNFTLVKDKLKFFIKYANIFVIFTFIAAVASALIVPFLGSERNLFLHFWFPLDWKNNEIAFWIAFTFNLMEEIHCCVATCFPIIMWYLLLNSALKFEVLGNEIENMGTQRDIEAEAKIRTISGGTRINSETENQNLYKKRFIAAVKSHENVKDATEQLESFIAKMLSVQTATGAISICCSTYCLAFNQTENLIELILYGVILFYNLFDIFMVMYFGNEIKLSSERLPYCLFESSWFDQPQSCKKLITIFAELLKQPYQLIILKLYPLTLETFTRILNSAYSMFNILKSL